MHPSVPLNNLRQSNTPSTMSSTSSTTPIPLTTPFIFPSNCSNRFPDTIIETQSYVSGAYTYNLFPSRENDPLCQPSGVTTYPTPGRQFSPAVCPSAWTAYDVRVLTYQTGTVSIAKCCSRYVDISVPFIPSCLNLLNSH